METPLKSIESATLESIPGLAWDRICAAVGSAKNPFHTPSLATCGEFGPAQRTVVLRYADPAERLLACHSDRRSGKIRDLQADERSSWLFYDRELKLQLRLGGPAALHLDDAFADKRWDATNDLGRACYTAGQGPGARLEQPGKAPARIRDASEERLARSHFAVVACRVDFLDWLFLSVKGHRRARFHWRGGGWEGGWVRP